MRVLIFLLGCLFLAVPSRAAKITVEADGSGDYPTIQAAINAANNGDIIELQPGIYTGSGNRDIDFLGKAITVRSTDPNDPNIVAATIIDCNATEEEAHRGFYFHSQEDLNSVVDGMTISNGYAPTENFYGYEQSIGGAILCYQSSPTISNCHLTNNSAGGIWGSGGAIGCREGDPAITGCTITNNFIVADWGDGAAISCYNYSSPTINNCIIAGNKIELTPGSVEDGLGGGICCYTFSEPIISNCVISGNLIRGPGWGGGIFCSYHGNPFIRNCTFVGNTATRGGALHCDEGSEASMVNCILWGDNAIYGPEISMTTIDWGSRLSISFSNVEGGQAAVYDVDGLDWGPGNIDTDPCFVEPGYWDPNSTPDDPNDDFWVDGDYHLKSEGWRWDSDANEWAWDDVTSRCIDAGNPGSPLGDEPIALDVDPLNRFGQNLRINMGAYGGTAEASMSPYDWALLADLTNDGTVDFNDLAHWTENWLSSGSEQPGDLDRNGIVDMLDYALFAQDCFLETTWHE